MLDKLTVAFNAPIKLVLASSEGLKKARCERPLLSDLHTFIACSYSAFHLRSLYRTHYQLIHPFSFECTHCVH